ncbi:MULTISPECIES: protein TolR [Desulfatibacillum]|jgi:biopolymer transport protein TolR|uniref:Biopolymer transport protein ExbD/TolR n=2 Tax=Desulfatibacillum TaxID=218207 RepID=B8FBT0_DESAL|nr:MULTISPECIES: protein TolR [Desulfatibacillum]ACL04833.1 Biopolymer transport protein ExbD/TolR [Desulfatibacillum aliphaticivorans]SHI78726.1 Cell division and transport-associated protein TolR [Desulfatibacillum alkenivorans DSM 16219]
MAGTSETDRLMSEINVTPFVDVMLVLLIIFMVTAPMMVQGVDVALPTTTSAPMETDESNVTITIDKRERVYINDAQIQIDMLGQKIAAIYDQNRDLRFFLRADKDVRYGLVVRVMADVKEAGIPRLGAITVPLPDEESK